MSKTERESFHKHIEDSACLKIEINASVCLFGGTSSHTLNWAMDWIKFLTDATEEDSEDKDSEGKDKNNVTNIHSLNGDSLYISIFGLSIDCFP